MATALSRPGQVARQVILRDISWETYERLLSEHGERSGTRFIYHRGMLEIIIVSYRHEITNRIIASLVEMLAEQLNIDVMGAGSTTFQRQDLASGFEPDSCFYIARAESMRGKDAVDLLVDPPPDLVIEIDITRPSLPRFPVFAGVGVPEVWRYDGSKVSVHQLDSNSGAYHETAQSAALPGVSGEVLTGFTEAGLTEKRHQWLKRVRAWAREAGRS
ncbi:MAG: Uma2 family endonuclease [Gammaproteobacteria bacterium]